MEKEQHSLPTEAIASIPAMQAVGASLTPTSIPTEAPRSIARTHPKIKNSSYQKSLQTLANSAAIAFAVLLWWFGAQFTLAWLQGIGVPIGRFRGFEWLIPLGITGIELMFWPHRGVTRHHMILFLIIGGFDLLTSVLGGHVWIAARWNFAPEAVWGIATIGAIACAFWPEKLIRASIVDIRKTWNI